MKLRLSLIREPRAALEVPDRRRSPWAWVVVAAFVAVWVVFLFLDW